MEVLNGIKIKELPFILTKKGDVLFYNGPILSHFKSNDSKDFFMLWLDNDIIYTRWLLFYVSEENLKRYFSKSLSLLELVLCNQKDFIYFIDIDCNIDYKNIIRKAVKDFPMEYAPGENSFFNIDFSNGYTFGL